MFISPTEPEVFKALGVVSLTPEEYGADILWQSKLGLVGVQRKEFPNDFLASVHDGRLNREYAQMKALDVAVLMLEGRPRWTLGDQLIRDRNGKRNAWTKQQHRNYLTSVQMRGIQVHWTEDKQDSVKFLQGFHHWTEKADHSSLDHRPAAARSDWGTISNEDYVRYLYQSLPGINTVLANAIMQTLGVIFRLEVTEEELMTVPGIGKGRAKNIVKVFRKVK